MSDIGEESNFSSVTSSTCRAIISSCLFCNSSSWVRWATSFSSCFSVDGTDLFSIDKIIAAYGDQNGKQ